MGVFRFGTLDRADSQTFNWRARNVAGVLKRLTRTGEKSTMTVQFDNWLRVDWALDRFVFGSSSQGPINLTNLINVMNLLLILGSVAEWQTQRT